MDERSGKNLERWGVAFGAAGLVIAMMAFALILTFVAILLLAGTGG